MESLPRLRGRNAKSLIERFWEKVEKRESGCWEWTGAKIRDGYGVIGVDGKDYKAHRLSYLLAYGEIPDGLFICHRCDNPSCVRPSHLFEGTANDNVHDMIAKARARLGSSSRLLAISGENNTKAKLNERSVRELRRRYLEGTSFADLAREFEVGEATARNAALRISWRHIA